MTNVSGEGYAGITAAYPPNTPEQQKFSGEALKTFITYLLSITLPDSLNSMLDRGFRHIDGWLQWDSCEWNSSDRPEVGGFTVIKGRRKFVEVFRKQIVAKQAVPDGEIKTLMIPRRAAELLEGKVARELRKMGVKIPGQMIAAGIVYFPNRLREGGDPLELPPYLSGVSLGFEPIRSEGLGRDEFTIRVVQILYGRKSFFGRLVISGRVGLCLTSSSVPQAISEEVISRRRGAEPSYFTPKEEVEKLVRWAA